MMERFAPVVSALVPLFRATSSALPIRFRYAVMGGLAVSTWGTVRATQDIDVMADATPSPLRAVSVETRLARFWEAKKWRVEWRRGVADDPVPLLVRLGPPGCQHFWIDVLWAHKQWQRNALQRAIPIRIAATALPVVHPEDLILLKLEAGGPQDFLDVEGIVSAAPSELDVTRLRRRAGRLRLSRELNRCIERARRA